MSCQHAVVFVHNALAFHRVATPGPEKLSWSCSTRRFNITGLHPEKYDWDFLEGGSPEKRPLNPQHFGASPKNIWKDLHFLAVLRGAAQTPSGSRFRTRVENVLITLCP